MKLLNVLSITAFGVLYAVGCSSTTTTTTGDGGSGTDTGTATGDTGMGGGDTGMGGGDTGMSGGDAAACQSCLETKCKTEYNTCLASTDCKNVIKCVQSCADATCANACVSDETKPGVKDANNLLNCGQTNCAAACM